MIGDEDQLALGITATKAIDLMKTTGIRNVSMLDPKMITKDGFFNQRFNAPGMRTTNMKGPFSIFSSFGSYNTNLDLVNKNKFSGSQKVPRILVLAPRDPLWACRLPSWPR